MEGDGVGWKAPSPDAVAAATCSMASCTAAIVILCGIVAIMFGGIILISRRMWRIEADLDAANGRAEAQTCEGREVEAPAGDNEGEELALLANSSAQPPRVEDELKEEPCESTTISISPTRKEQLRLELEAMQEKMDEALNYVESLQQKMKETLDSLAAASANELIDG